MKLYHLRVLNLRRSGVVRIEVSPVLPDRSRTDAADRRSFIKNFESDSWYRHLRHNEQQSFDQGGLIIRSGSQPPLTILHLSLAVEISYRF
jgi:hypothetical protein